jgi:hypothetical protein
LTASLVLISVVLPAFGQSEEKTSGYSVWIPQKMIAGKDYEGLVVLDQATNLDSTFFLSTSDKSSLDVPDSIVIPRFTNHGIFEIKPLREGNATVFAAFGGKLVQENTIIYTSNIQPASLEIVLPTNTTKAYDMLAYVFTKDQSGLPSPVSQDTEIDVITSSMIKSSKTVTIPKGQYYAQLQLVTKGSGQISVSAQGLGIATANITKLNDDVQVRFAVAPDVVIPNSIAHYYIWLEKDGKPFKPPYGIHAVLTSANTDVARFGSNYDIKNSNDILHYTTLDDGVATGTVHTINGGNSTISASVDGFGSASATLVVGPARTDLEQFSGNLTDTCNQFSCTPNLIRMWVYPPTFDDASYGIVGLYRQISSPKNVLIPLPDDSSLIAISSDSQDLKYAREIEMIQERIPGTNQDDGPASSVQFEIGAGSTGNYTITASGAGKIPGSAQISVMPRYYDSYHIGITPLPARSGMMQDLGIMYIYDRSGAMVEPSSVFAEPPDVIIKTSIRGVQEKLQFASSNMVLSGILYHKSRIAAYITGLPPADILVAPDDIATNIDLDLPSRVHVGERLPFVVYKTNSLGVPLELDVPKAISVTGGVTLDSSGKYLTINREGNMTVSILSSDGAVTESVKSFYNIMHIVTDTNGTVLQVGKKNMLDVTSDVKNVIYSFQSPFSIVQVSQDRYFISPPREGIFDVTIFAHKDGFRPTSDTVHFVAKKIIDISITAAGNDGAKLSIIPVMTINNRTFAAATPFNSTSEMGLAYIDIPQQFDIEDKNYTLDFVDISGRKFTDGRMDIFLDNDTKIKIKYYLMLKVDALQAKGGGVYPYGSIVTLYAPEKWNFLFLVRQVFDHWQGDNLPFGSGDGDVSFVVKENVFATAVYRQDYTYLMLATAVPVTGLYVMKKRNSIVWNIKELKASTSLLRRSGQKTRIQD